MVHTLKTQSKRGRIDNSRRLCARRIWLRSVVDSVTPKEELCAKKLWKFIFCRMVAISLSWGFATNWKAYLYEREASLFFFFSFFFVNTSFSYLSQVSYVSVPGCLRFLCWRHRRATRKYFLYSVYTITQKVPCSASTRLVLFSTVQIPRPSVEML